MEKQNIEIGFLDSYCAETSVVPKVIDHLLEDLHKLKYPQEEIDEIILSMDESITNAIQETINKNKHSDICQNHNDRRDITIRYTVCEDQFDATIIDHGKGLDIFNILKSVPDVESDNYSDEIISYATESEKSKIKVRINGEEIPLRGIGAGLKIILNFMDTVTIDLIDKEKIISDSVTENTDGTIFSMKRKRRYAE